MASGRRCHMHVSGMRSNGTVAILRLLDYFACICVIEICIPNETPSTAGFLAVVLVFTVAGYLNWHGAILMVVYIVVVNLFVNGYSISSAMGLPLLTVFLVASGVIVRFFEDRVRLQHCAERRLCRMVIAAQLHDHVCNDLSVLLLQMDGDFSADADTLVKYHSSVEHILQKVRHIVTVLDSDDELVWKAEVVKKVDVTRIQRIVSSCEQSALELGLAGIVSSCIDEDAVILVDDEILIIDIIHELYGNMMKYADRNVPYCFSLNVTSTRIALSIVNATQIPVEDVFRSGTGLQRIRHRVESKKGRVALDGVPGHWGMTVSFPLSLIAENIT